MPALVRCPAGPVLLVGAPHAPFGPGLAAQGLAFERLLRVDAGPPAQRLWACEQALRCADVPGWSSITHDYAVFGHHNGGGAHSIQARSAIRSV